MDTSIVIPVKDDEHIFLCLQKLLKIIDKKQEILVINDMKSADDFSNSLLEFCKINKIYYYRAKKPGAAYNRNRGMQISKGKNILFIDSDCLPDKKWVINMESSLKENDVVEGKIIYGSKERTVLDRAVENLDTPNLFLTANLGIKKTVFRKCKFDERFIVFREDTDFGLSALEHGFKSTFNTNAKVFHKKSKFSIKRFIFERERYIGEPLLLKKHLNNELVNNYIKRIGRILYPEELVFMILMVSFLFYNPLISLVFYFFPGGFYLFKKYKTKKYIFNARDSAVVLLLLPVTMFVKRLAMWKGAIRFKIFCV